NKLDGVTFEQNVSDDDVYDLGNGTHSFYGTIIPSESLSDYLSNQLSSKDKRTSSSALDEFLTNYLSKFGITVEQITDFKERFG
ncbi:hypothetical protein, partial [Caballeronia sp. ASUFL_F2_KS49]|uniref:hypothetical protein n=1 Tax=Caballeronia sp. ASUFL_F2_KS49 TaxID=2921773 RepID=UPI002029387C